VNAAQKQRPDVNSNVILVNALSIVLADIVGEIVQRVRKLEMSSLSYAGIFEAGRCYKSNTLITHRGSMWVSIQETTLAPGVHAEPQQWRLVSKSNGRG
jgi:hypothetical protein